MLVHDSNKLSRQETEESNKKGLNKVGLHIAQKQATCCPHIKLPSLHVYA